MNSNNSIYDMRSRVKRYERWERPFLGIILFMTIYANSHFYEQKMLESSYFLFPLKSLIFYPYKFIDVSSSTKPTINILNWKELEIKNGKETKKREHSRRIANSWSRPLNLLNFNRYISDGPSIIRIMEDLIRGFYARKIIVDGKFKSISGAFGD